MADIKNCCRQKEKVQATSYNKVNTTYNKNQLATTAVQTINNVAIIITYRYHSLGKIHGWKYS